MILAVSLLNIDYVAAGVLVNPVRKVLGHVLEIGYTFKLVQSLYQFVRIQVFQDLFAGEGVGACQVFLLLPAKAFAEAFAVNMQKEQKLIKHTNTHLPVILNVPRKARLFQHRRYLLFVRVLAESVADERGLVFIAPLKQILPLRLRKVQPLRHHADIQEADDGVGEEVDHQGHQLDEAAELTHQHEYVGELSGDFCALL